MTYKYSYTGTHLKVIDDIGHVYIHRAGQVDADFIRRLVERANASDAEFDRLLVAQASALCDDIPTIPGKLVKRVKIICQTETD